MARTNYEITHNKNFNTLEENIRVMLSGEEFEAALYQGEIVWKSQKENNAASYIKVRCIDEIVLVSAWIYKNGEEFDLSGDDNALSKKRLYELILKIQNLEK